MNELGLFIYVLVLSLLGFIAILAESIALDVSVVIGCLVLFLLIFRYFWE